MANSALLLVTALNCMNQTCEVSDTKSGFHFKSKNINLISFGNNQESIWSKLSNSTQESSRGYRNRHRSNFKTKNSDKGYLEVWKKLQSSQKESGKGARGRHSRNTYPRSWNRYNLEKVMERLSRSNEESLRGYRWRHGSDTKTKPLSKRDLLAVLRKLQSSRGESSKGSRNRYIGNF